MHDARTEPATPRKLRLARERGEVWRSASLTAACVLVASTAAGAWLVPATIGRLRAYVEAALCGAVAARPASPAVAAEAGLDVVVACLVPIGAVAFFAAAATDLLQVRPLFTVRPLVPALSRLDPRHGLRRLLEGRGPADAGLAALHVAVVGAVLATTIVDHLPTLAAMPGAEVATAGGAAARLAHAILLRGAVAVLVVGVLDLLRQRAAFVRDQRMTRREVEREHRDLAGDPWVAAARFRAFRTLSGRSGQPGAGEKRSGSG